MKLKRKWAVDLPRLVRLLLTPTWKLRMMQQLHHAEMEYDAASNAYSEAIGEDRPSVHASNQAHYWKGRCDALRVFLTNSELSPPKSVDNSPPA